jgi:ribonuclease HI
MARAEVMIFTDGACDPNPGIGGWAALLRSGTREKTLSGGYRRTTNNRMELRAVIEGLRALKQPDLPVTIVSDSQYVTRAVSLGWLDRWAARQFRKAGGLRENADLWLELRPLLARHRVTMKWIRGHAGQPDNEACDRLAVLARARAGLPIDEGFENPASRMAALGALQL